MAGASSPSAMSRLVERFSRLPGIGKRSAERMAFHLLRQPPEEAEALAAAITALKADTRPCSICGNIAETDPCPICGDPGRDHGQVLVVEQPSDVATIETTALYRGVYHVLMGRLAPLDGVGPGELNIEPLLDRAGRSRAPRVGDARPRSERDTPETSPPARQENGAVREVILGTPPTLEGDGTALYLAERLRALGVQVSRLARGLPTGANLDVVSKAVLADAIECRQDMR